MTELSAEDFPPTLDSRMLERMIQEAEWRGQVQARLDDHSTQASNTQSTLLARIGELETNFNRRMDKQDREISGIHSQTKNTNGRVSALEVEREKEEAIEVIRIENAQKVADSIRFRVTSKVMILCAFIGGGMGEVIHILATHHF